MAPINHADEMVPKHETIQRQLDDAAAGSFDNLKEQLRAVVERPSHQPKPVGDLHGADSKLDEPLRTTVKSLRPISLLSKPVADLHGSGDNERLEDLLRLSPQRKPEEEEEEEELERDGLRPGIASYPDLEALEHRANYDLSIGNKMTRRSSRGFVRYLVAILIGVAATLAWQSYGDVAKQIIATSAPELGSSPEARQMIAKSIQQLGWTKPPVVESKTAPAAPATPSIDPVQVQQMIQTLAALRESVQQLAGGQKSLAALAQTVDQLAASQDQMVHQIEVLQTSNKEILAKITPPPPPPRAIATPARKPTPTAVPSPPAPVAAPISLAPIPPPDR